MKEIVLSFIIQTLSVVAFAQQQETFDLVTYTPPKGWKAEQKKNVMGYTITDVTKKNWCQIGIYRSTTSNGNIESDFKQEWNELAVKQYKATGLKENAIEIAEDWKIKAGAGKFRFNNADATVLLTTISGYNICVSIIAVSNTEDYNNQVQTLLESVVIKKTDPNKPAPAPAKNPDNNSSAANASIAGTWIKSGSVNPSYGNSVSWGAGGYTKDQYTFFTNGTYTFYSKSFGYAVTNLIIAKETGTYTLSENKMTILPTSSEVEAWSKKDGADKWGKLVSSQKRPLEKNTYQFTKHYFSGIQQWNLVLQSANPTNRDGSFSTFTLFSNAYYYVPLSPNNTAIELPPSISKTN